LRWFDDEEGWGVVDVPGVADGIFVHFSAIATEGFAALAGGEAVEVDHEGPLPFDQDGYRYRATTVQVLPRD
jgi:CspA family cold shock protein